jgi:DNA-binding IclR family transcriptional regulator
MGDSLALLAVIARRPGPAHAVARELQVGTVYRLLESLETAGLVRRTRGTYRITRRGRNELRLQRLLAAATVRARLAA